MSAGTIMSGRQWPKAIGRRVVALAMSAALLVRSAAPAVADAFCASRLGESYAGALGMLPAGIDCAAVLAQASS